MRSVRSQKQWRFGWSPARARLSDDVVDVSEFSFTAGEGRFVTSGSLPASRDIKAPSLVKPTSLRCSIAQTCG
jgi:hypothetical protein